VLMRGGAFLHELGHCLAARRFTTLAPAAFCLRFAYAAREDRVKHRRFPRAKRILSILFAHGGIVWYDGSTDPYSVVTYPPRPSAERFERVNPGRKEARSAAGGSALQFLYAKGLFLIVWFLRHLSPALALLVFLSTVTNFAVAFVRCLCLRSGDSHSDGFYIWPRCRRSLGKP
jgi:hypothetical protein